MLVTIYIGLLIVGITLLCAGSVQGYKRPALIGAVIVLFMMNNAFKNTFLGELAELIEVGLPIFFMMLVAAGLILAFRINPFALPSRKIGIADIFLILLLALILLSVTSSLEPLRTIKSVISLAGIIFIGWFIFGNIYKKNPTQSRELLILVADVFGALSLVSVLLVMMLAGPDVIRQGTADITSTISLLGIKVRRLQAEGFNATGVGASAAMAILWLLSLFQRAKHRYLIKVLISIFVAISLVGLFWSGSRGAIIAFFTTWFAVRIIGLPKRKMLLNIISTFTLLGVSLFLFLNYFEGILYRGYQPDKRPELLELFVSGRLYNLKKDMLLALEPSLFGRGYGSMSAKEFSLGVNVESFFVRIFVELGVVGSLVYVITFAILTVCVVRADRNSCLRGERGAFFPSAILLFVWISSPTGFGFSLPVGVLAIQLALAAGARSYSAAVSESRYCKISPAFPAKLP